MQMKLIFLTPRFKSDNFWNSEMPFKPIENDVAFYVPRFQGHPVLESVSQDSCIIRIRWLTSAACGDEQKAELDKCRVHDYSTGEYYDLNRLSPSHSGDFNYHIVVR